MANITNEDGAFAISLPPAGYVIRAYAPGSPDEFSESPHVFLERKQRAFVEIVVGRPG